MKITVVGPGGVGSYYSVKLKKSGNIVNVIARGESLKKIRENGITLEVAGQVENAMPDLVTDKFEEAGVSDLVILAVKAWNITEILDSMKLLIGERTTVLPIQNGVEPYDLTRRKYCSNVIGGLTKMISILEKPGHVRNAGGEVSVTIGENDGSRTERVKEIADVFRSAGIECYISEDIRKSLWEKFLIMANLGGIGAVTRAPVGVLLSVAKTRDMLAEAINEVMEVGKAAGVALNNESRTRAWDFIKSIPPDASTSIQRDIMEGKPSELEFMSGSVIRIGKEYGIKTPVHDFIYSCLVPWELRARKLVNF